MTDLAEKTAPAPADTARQRGRSEVDFMASASAYANGRLRDEARERYESAAEGIDVPDDFEGRFATVSAIANGVKEWRFDQLYMRFVAEGLAASGALAGVEMGGAELVDPAEHDAAPRDPDFEAPDYFTAVNFHAAPWYTETPKYKYRTPASSMMKVINRAGVAAVPIGSDILQQRADVAAQATVESPEKILDMGTGGNGQFMARIQDRFPDAEIHGVDLAGYFLRGPAAVAKARGDNWVLSQQNAEHTTYADNTFDLITSYALVHELPAEITGNILTEALRILKPGGELLFGDVPPYRQIPDFQFLVYDWETEGRVEPYWREECLLNRGQLASDIGFVSVEEYGIGPTDYPWVLRARKPQ